MITTNAGTTIFHHSSSFSGDVKVVVPAETAELSTEFGGVEISVPFEDIKTLVLAYMEARLIGAIEDMSYKELEDFFLWRKLKEG